MATNGKMNINCPEPKSEKIVSKPASDKYRENWDMIFSKKDKENNDNIQEVSNTNTWRSYSI